MKWYSDTLVGRTVLASLIGITLMHILSLWSYEHALERELSMAQEAQLAERLLTIRRSMALVTEPDRDTAAHRLSSGPLEVHWSAKEHAINSEPLVEPWISLKARLLDLERSLKDPDVIIAPAGSAPADPHLALVSLRLPDESWVNVSLLAYARPHTGGHGTLLSTSVMALGVIALSVVIAGWVTRPMRHMAQTVRDLRPSDLHAKLDETGPLEVRELATAFNDMRARIAKLIDERTHALAAVSHDLKTPLTRLKLRVEDLKDRETAADMSRDITDVEEMIDATLSYLRGNSATEPVRPLDLAVLLRTLADDASDMGHEVTFTGPRSLVIEAKHLSLKRALSNLIQNALKYGKRADVSLTRSDSAVVVTIEDQGPGIPEDKLELVLEPFVRLETSRNRETGGVGLGLTIAKTEIEANRGTLSLANKADGGLRATALLETKG